MGEQQELHQGTPEGRPERGQETPAEPEMEPGSEVEPEGGAEGETKKRASQRLLPVRIGIALLLVVCLALVWSEYGPHILDDAYITFRYSRNLAEGRGIVYNPGERVQGSSTPLFTLVLGGLGALGIPIPPAGLVLSVVPGIVTLILLIYAGYRLGAESVGWVSAFALSLEFFWVVQWVSGMETTFYCALIVGALLAVSLERWRWVGALAGVACLIRYDGALLAVAVLAVVAWRAGWKRALREAVIAAVITLPWWVFAWAYFGSPIPQSVRAKMVIDTLSWKAVFDYYMAYLFYSSLLRVWALLSIFGMIQVVRRSRPWVVFPLWTFLYFGVFVYERRPVMFYPWYVVPLLPPVLLMGAFGLRELIRLGVSAVRKTQWGIPAFCIVAATLVMVEASKLQALHYGFGADTMHRERKYELAAKILSPYIHPGQTVYVGEVGTLGWFLPKARILDSTGLLAPSVYEIRVRDRHNLALKGRRPSEDPDGSADVTRMVVEELRPDFITTTNQFLFIKEVEKAPWFRARYEPIAESQLAALGQVAFRRIDTDSEAKKPAPSTGNTPSSPPR